MKAEGAIIAAIIALGLAIGAWATSWYKIELTTISKLDSSDSDTTTTTFFWVQYITSDSSSGKSQTIKYTGNSGALSPPNYPDIATTFSNCLAFLTAGAACLIATIVLQGLRVWCKFGKGSNCWRIIGQLIVTAATVLLAVSFFSFLNITKAFSNEQWPECLTGINNYDNYMCSSVLGKNTTNGLVTTTDYDWKPDVGWWLLLASLFVSFFSVGGVLASGKL